MNTRQRIILSYFLTGLGFVMFFLFSWKLFLAVAFLLTAGIIYAPTMGGKKE